MPFSFGAICDLLQSLEADRSRKRWQKGSARIIIDWFAEHRAELDARDVDKTAFLSTLLPERRTDRVYNIQHNRLESIATKAFGLGSTRQHELARWREQGSGVDLAECVEKIIADAPNGFEQDVTVEEIDGILHQLAARVPFSSPAVRSSGLPRRKSTSADPKDDQHPLADLLRKMTPRDAKWLCRLVLKNFLPVEVPEYLVYSQCHPLLPAVLKMLDNFAVATTVLDQQRRISEARGVDLEKADLPRLIKPQVGVKVGRQTWLKARSIQHCLEMGRGLMSCEHKLDGEYCQIHIDLSKGHNCIQIFSKSGKDSTRDRINLHDAVRSSLGLGTAACRFKKHCILEGELVAWDDQQKRVLGFERIRRHVNRSGRFIGMDSQPPASEHLMIVYYDLLLVDDESMLNVRHSDRFLRMSTLVYCSEGRTTLVERQVINFSSRLAVQELREAFATCIVNKEEGLVLKPDDPYFNFQQDKREYASCCLKLKKGFVKGLGEIGDFAVVGARYDPTRAKVLDLPKTKYTHFYLGCLVNKAEVIRFEEARPKFVVAAEVELNTAMTEYFKRYVFTRSVTPEENHEIDLELHPGIMQGKRIDTVFLHPAVFEITCFDFHKEGNAPFWSPRFSYVSKIHIDRSWKDCFGLDELQDLAEDHRAYPEQKDSQELADWIKALEDADPKSRRKTVEQGTQSTDAIREMDTIREKPSQQLIVKSPSTHLNSENAGQVSSGVGCPLQPISSSAIQHPARSPTDSPKPNGRSPRKRRRDTSPASPRWAKQRKDDGTPVARLSRAETYHEDPSASTSSPLLPRLPVAASFDSTTKSSSPLKAHGRAPSFKPSTSDIRPSGTANPTCRYAGRMCAFAGHFVLLAPCVASIPWLTEDLLPGHGVAAVFKDIPSWLASTSLPGSSRRQPRVVLVERCRREATKEFLSNLRAEPLKGRNGQPEVVMAYDWRLLEAITDEENVQRKSDGSGTRQKIGTGAHGKELWKKHFVGLC